MLFILGLTFLLAHHGIADVSELVQSGNGFLYDAPRTSGLPLAPLDLANDEQTHKAFEALTHVMPSNMGAAIDSFSSQVDVIPSLATSASLKRQSYTYSVNSIAGVAQTTTTTTNSFKSHSAPLGPPKVSSPSSMSLIHGYNYNTPQKQFYTV